MNATARPRYVGPFNGPVEIGLRALALLTEAFPLAYSLQQLVITDYLIVHTDDLPDGPVGLHPQTPHRGEELLVRRRVLQEGLVLYQSRGLVAQRFDKAGVLFNATDRSGAFLDALESPYVAGLRERGAWLVESFGQLSETQLQEMVKKYVGVWGAEFALESVLWTEELQ